MTPAQMKKGRAPVKNATPPASNRNEAYMRRLRSERFRVLRLETEKPAPNSADRPLRGFWMQTQAERTHDLEQRRKIRAALARQGLVQTFARQPRVAGNLRHAACARNVSERLRDERGIIARFFERGFYVQPHLFFGAQMVGDIVGGSGNGHGSILQFTRHLKRAGNITALRTLSPPHRSST